MEKQQVSYWELEGTYQEIGKQMAKQPEKNHIYIFRLRRSSAEKKWRKPSDYMTGTVRGFGKNWKAMHRRPE
ncbi:hypothetical protein [Eisenbergiella tayi]